MTNPDLPRQHPNLTLAVLAVAAVVFALLQSLVSPALPEIQHELETTETAVSWVITGYLLSAAICTPIVGRLGDMFGKEKMLMVALVALLCGLVISALATSITTLVAGRLVQGVASGVFPLAFGIIRDEFPREKVAGGIGAISAITGIGGGLGVVLSGVVVDNLSWHWLFWMPAIAIAITMVLTHFMVPESPLKTPGEVNFPGAVLMALGIGGFLLAISMGSDWGWGAPETVGLFAASILFVVLWIRQETGAREPLVDMRMMRQKGVWTTNTVATMMGAGMFSTFILVPQIAQLPEETGFGLGATVTQSGLYMLPATVMMMVAGAFAGRLEGRFGSKPPLVVGGFVSASAFTYLALAHSSALDLMIGNLIFGLGLGLAFAAMANLIVQAVPQEQTGVATGMNTVMRSIGGAIGAQVVAVFLTENVIGGIPSEDGFVIGFFFGAAMMVLSAVVALAVPTTPPGRTAEAATDEAHAGRDEQAVVTA